MATYTENYNLKMPSGQDAPDVEDFNANAEIIDQTLKQHEDGISSLNSRLNHVRFVCTPNSGLIDGSICVGYYDRASGTVRLAFNFASASDLLVTTDLFVIPEAYRPSGNYDGPLMYVSNFDAVGAYTATARPDGGVRQNGGNSIRQGIGYIEYPLST